MKKILILAIAIFCLMFAAAVQAEIPTDPNSGPTEWAPVDNSAITTPAVNSNQPSGEGVTPPEKVTIIVNGKEIVSDVEPFIEDGRTMVPFRFVAEALGCNVMWDDPNQRVYATKAKTTIAMTIGKKEIIVNGVSKPVDKAPILKKDRTFIPIRHLSEAMGYRVDWEQATNTVYISDNTTHESPPGAFN